MTVTTDELRDRVIKLWNGNNGWIPGTDYKELADALDIDPDRLIHLGHRLKEET
jgi:hypothetical protein